MANTKRRKRRSNSVYILEIILCLIALTAMTFAMLFLVRYHDMRERVEELQAKIDIYEDPEDPYISRSEADSLISAYESSAYASGMSVGEDNLLEAIKEGLIDTGSALETLKQFYPNDLLIVDSGAYHFFPISDELKHHNYADEDFETLDNGRIVYNGDASATEVWIDVSKFQDKITWSKVADADVDGAIIRLGYRGYSKGEIMDDDTFETNIRGALNNDLKVGVYFLTQAVSDREAREEAEYVLDMIEDYDIDGPIVLDVEAVGGDEGRGNALAQPERTQYVKTFLDTVRSAGYDVSIYGNLKTFLIMLDLSELEDYDKWFAGYTNTPYYPYAMNMWQYTDTGRVDGISGNVDINIKFVGDND